MEVNPGASSNKVCWKLRRRHQLFLEGHVIVGGVMLVLTLKVRKGSGQFMQA